MSDLQNCPECGHTMNLYTLFFSGACPNPFWFSCMECGAELECDVMYEPKFGELKKQGNQ